MKRVLAISAVFVLGCVTGGVASQLAVPPAHAAAATAQRWEYNCGVDPSLKQLNEVGAEGWELVTASPFHGAASGQTAFCFKRPL